MSNETGKTSCEQTVYGTFGFILAALILLCNNNDNLQHAPSTQASKQTFHWLKIKSQTGLFFLVCFK